MKELTVRNAQIAAYIGSLSKTSPGEEMGAVLLATGGLTGVGGSNANDNCGDNCGNCINTKDCKNKTNGGDCGNYSGACSGSKNGGNCINTTDKYQPGGGNILWTCPK